jgi:hypothetical protein
VSRDDRARRETAICCVSGPRVEGDSGIDEGGIGGPIPTVTGAPTGITAAVGDHSCLPEAAVGDPSLAEAAIGPRGDRNAASDRSSIQNRVVGRFAVTGGHRPVAIPVDGAAGATVRVA